MKAEEKKKKTVNGDRRVTEMRQMIKRQNTRESKTVDNNTGIERKYCFWYV